MPRFAVSLACLLIWLSAATSLGQPEQEAPAVSVDVESGADAQRADLTAAIAAYEAGDFVRARELFERVHTVAPTARTLRSLALVAYKQGRFAAALQQFEASLDSPVKPLTADMREDVQGLMAAVREELARSQSERTLEPAPVVPAAAAVQAAEPAGSPEVRAGPAPKAAPRDPVRTRRLRRAGFALLGLTAASLLGGGAALLTGMLRLNDIEATCRGNWDQQCSRRAVRELERAGRLDLLSALASAGFALAGASAVASATTLTLSYQAPRGSERRAPVVGLTFRTVF